MINVSTQCERLTTIPPLIVSGAGGSKADVLPNRISDPKYIRDVVFRMIQNLDPNNAIYVAYGSDCTAVNYHKVLGALQDLNVPTMERVSVFSANAWSVATVEMTRQL